MDDTDWSLIDFEPPKKPIPAEEKNACPKCGRKLGRGGHFHIAKCKGE